MRRIEEQGKLFPRKERESAYGHTTYTYRISLVRDRRVKFSDKAVSTPRIGAELIRNTIKKAGQSDRENLVVIMLSSKNEITGTNIVSQGSLNGSIVTMREIFKPAIIANSAAILMGHNHPSGNCDPSDDDKVITKKTREAGELLGIRLLDHIIVCQDEPYFSFSDNGLMG